MSIKENNEESKIKKWYIEYAPWIATILGIGVVIGFFLEDMIIVDLFLILVIIIAIPYLVLTLMKYQETKR